MNSPPTPDPWIDCSIGDRQRYRLEKRLGAGGMGDVFLAMDTLLGKQVALKLLKETLLAEDLRKRFERVSRGRWVLSAKFVKGCSLLMKVSLCGEMGQL